MSVMDSLERIRLGHKKLREKPDVMHPVTDEEADFSEHNRSLGDIMADKDEHALFLSFLGQQKGEQAKEIVEALSKKELLTEKDDKWLEDKRKAYNMRRFEAEKVEEMLTPETIQQIAELDPRIKLVVGKIGPERAEVFLGKEFGRLAIEDTTKFNAMVRHLRGLKEIKTNPLKAALEREFQVQLLKYGISEETYIDATQDGVSVKTQEALSRAAAEQYGIFRKSVDWVTRGALSHRAGRAMYMTFQEQKKFMDEIDTCMKGIGKVLAATLNADTRMAIQKAMLEGGDPEEKKERFNVNTIAEYAQAKQSLESVDLQKRWKEFQAAEIKRRNVKDLSKQPHLVEELKENFAAQELDRQKKLKGKGVLGMLLAALFAFVTKDSIKSSLT
jgi:hypothetical protein